MSLIRSRRAVFDIGMAGPLAGLVVALPALYFGLRGTPPLAEALHTTGVYSGSSLLPALMYQFANGGELGTAVIQLSPVAFAGWIGLFITALNLMPVGQLGAVALTVLVLTIMPLPIGMRGLMLDRPYM